MPNRPNHQEDTFQRPELARFRCPNQIYKGPKHFGECFREAWAPRWMREPTQIHDIEMLVAAQGGKANRTHIVYSMAVAEQGTGERGHEKIKIGRRRRRKDIAQQQTKDTSRKTRNSRVGCQDTQEQQQQSKHKKQHADQQNTKAKRAKRKRD